MRSMLVSGNSTKTRLRKIAPALIGGIALVAVTACEPHYGRYSLERGDTVLVGAETRAILNTAASYDAIQNTVRQSRMICAEPSPDIAIASSRALELVADLRSPTGEAITVNAGFAIAQTFAQLGERLATIQLLRDGLFQACQMYVNGALPRVAYGVLLSGVGEALVTLSAIEFGSGAFGRTLAAGSTTAGAGSLAGDSATPLLNAMQTALDAASTRLEAAEQALTTASGLEASVDDRDQRIAAAQAEVATATASRDAIVGSVAALSSAVAVSASGTSNPPGGGVEAEVSDAAIAEIRQMQTAYINDINYQSMIVACITALDWSTTRRGQINAPGEDDITLPEICAKHILSESALQKAAVLASDHILRLAAFDLAARQAKAVQAAAQVCAKADAAAAQSCQALVTALPTPDAMTNQIAKILDRGTVIDGLKEDSSS